MTSVACICPLKGISEPDALFVVYYVVLMLMPAYNNTKAQGWKAVLEMVVLHGNDCFHNEFWLVFQFFHQLC